MNKQQLIEMYTIMLNTRNVILNDKCTKPEERDMALREKKLIAQFIFDLENLLTL